VTAPTIDDLVGAQGELVAFVAVILERSAVAEVTEFAALLDTFADTVVETDPEQGRILAGWAAQVRAMRPH